MPSHRMIPATKFGSIQTMTEEGSRNPLMKDSSTMRAYYIVPLRRTVLGIECLTLRGVLDLIHSARRTHFRITHLFRGDEAFDVLITNPLPPFDQGKFAIDGKRHVGCGVILCHPNDRIPGVLEMEIMTAPIKSLEHYASEIMF
jgi:hypothetical protein